MKYHTILTVTFLLVILNILSSCNESDSIDTYQLPKFWNNLTESDWDSTSTANNLVGTWELTYRYCCPESTTGGKLINVENEGYQLSITSEKIYVFVNGELTQESNWLLQTRNAPAFRIDSNPYVSNTRGQIVFAENMVLFHGSPSDGADNYFERISEN